MRRMIALIAVVSMHSSVTLASAKEPPKVPGRHRYVITMSHDAEDCARLVNDWAKDHRQLLARVEWGCAGGTHSGWLEVAATSELAALGLIPPSSRERATVVAVETADRPGHLAKVRQQIQMANALQRAE